MADVHQAQAPAPPAPPDEPGRLHRRTAFGVLLISLGVLMLADELNIGLSPFGLSLSLGRLWPLILIVLGATSLWSTRSEGQPGRGYWLLFLGGLFLLHTYDILRLDQSWPLFIVAGGLSLMFKRDQGGRRRR